MSGALPPSRQTETLIGQERAEAEFARALAAGKPAHGWLLTGPSGIGKATLAWRVAKHLLSGRAPVVPAEGLPRLDPPPAQDPLTRRIIAGAHGDLLALSRETDGSEARGEIGVDKIRVIPGFFRQTAKEGGWRLVILEDAESLNIAAQNAILKILEEPPARAMLILTAQSPGRLLPTIRSRVRHLQMPPLAEADVLRILEHLLPAEDPADLRLVAGLAEGSVGRAEEMLSPQIRALLAEAQELLTSESYALPKALALAEKLSGRGAGAEEGWRRFVALLQAWVQRTLRAAARGQVVQAVATGQVTPEARLIARSGGLEQALHLWDRTRDLIEEGERANLDRRHTLLALFRLWRPA